MFEVLGAQVFVSSYYLLLFLCYFYSVLWLFGCFQVETCFLILVNGTDFLCTFSVPFYLGVGNSADIMLLQVYLLLLCVLDAINSVVPILNLYLACFNRITVS